MKIILLGAPGAGKGSVAAPLTTKYNIPHISTGDIFRQNIREQTELGIRAKAYMDRGELVPDEVTMSIVGDRLSKPDAVSGFVFDGFPRTIAQADALEGLADIDAVINLEVPFEILMRRLTGRRTCTACGNITHIDWQADNNCVKCGGGLYQRDDDNEATVNSRLTEYNNKTKPLIDYYQGKGKLVSINGNQTVSEVYAELERIICQISR